MSQVFAAIKGPVKPWRLLGPETARTFQLAAACTLAYTSGSPDTLPRDTAAAVDGGGVLMDLTTAVYVIYTLQGSGVLRAATESAPPDAGAYALLWRVTLEGVDLYPQIPQWVEPMAAITGLPDPGTAPTLSVVAGTSTLTAGTYVLATCWDGQNGSQTLLSPAATITITAGQVIHVVAGDAYPAGAVGMSVYAITTPSTTAAYTPALYQ